MIHAATDVGLGGIDRGALLCTILGSSFGDNAKLADGNESAM